MPALRNDKERNRIYDQAIRLFMEHGYAKTTYKDIANACDTTKSMVQHYFPKKELMVERFFHEKLDEFLNQAQSAVTVDHSLLDLLTCVGLFQYDFLLNSPQAKLFCADLLENRSLTNKIILEEFQWASERIQDSTPAGTTMRAQFIIALAGAFDLMHLAFQRGEQLTASQVQHAAMLALWLPMGLSADEVAQALRNAQELTGIQ